MNNSPIIVDQSLEDSQLNVSYANQSFDPVSISLFTQLNKNQMQNQSPSSVGSMKASPPFYHSPQITSSKQKISKFNAESGFSPALKHRIITQSNSLSILNKGGNNTPTSSHFKQIENSKDSLASFDIDRQSFRQGVISANFQSKLTPQNNNSPSFFNQIEKKGKKDDDISLPLIDPTQSVKKVKNKLSLLEDKQSFFKEVNKFSRKSFCTQPPTQNTLTSSEQVKTQQGLTSFSVIPPNSVRDQVNTESPQTSIRQLPIPTLTLQVNKSPKLISTSRPSIFQENVKEFSSNIKLDSDSRLTPMRIPSMSSTQLNYMAKLVSPAKTFNEQISNQSTSYLTQPRSKETPLKKSSLIFKYPILEDQGSLHTLTDLDPLNNTQTAGANGNKFSNNSQIQKKESTEIHSSQTFSSEDDISFNQAAATKKPLKKNIVSIRKLSQMDYTEKGFFSPQINNANNQHRRQTQNNMQLNQLNLYIPKLATPSNREDILLNLSNTKAQKTDRFMNLFTAQNSQEQQSGSTPTDRESSTVDRITLMRQFYYLLPDIKKYVTDEIEKDSQLRSDIFQFYMITDLHEFSFHFGQFLDHLAEQRQLTEKTFPYKFPKKIFSKINTLMHNLVSKQPQNSEQLEKLLNQQIQKSMHIIAPSTLLEALGGYCKVRNLSEQLSKMLYKSALSNHVIMYSEDIITQKVEEFLLAALQPDASKTKSMIEEFKKHAGSAFTGAEFYVLKQIVFNYFANHSYYSDEVKFSFFELMEGLRYQLTQDEGFTSSLLESKQEPLIKEFQFIWKQDPILSKLKETQKNSSLQFMQATLEFIFSQRNCFQLAKTFSEYFAKATLDILVVKSLHQMVKVATRRQSISHNLIQMHINFLFKKLQWFISKDNANYVKVVGDYKPISDQMLYIILNQRINKSTDSPTVQSPAAVENAGSQTEFDNANKTPTKTKSHNKFKMLQQLQQSTQLNSQKQNGSPIYQPLTDISNFSQFLSLFFNFYSTFHYSDLVSFFKSEKSSIEIFSFWTTIFGEALCEVRGVQLSTSNEIKKFVQDLFEFLKSQ